MTLLEVEQAIKDIETGTCHQDRHYYRKCMEFLVAENKFWKKAWETLALSASKGVVE